VQDDNVLTVYRASILEPHIPSATIIARTQALPKELRLMIFEYTFDAKAWNESGFGDCVSRLCIGSVEIARVVEGLRCCFPVDGRDVTKLGDKWWDELQDGFRNCRE
jgi:hypothetical protein